MERLSAEDRLTLWGDKSWPQDIGAVAILDGRILLEPGGGFLIDVVRNVIDSRLHLLPRFRQVLHLPGRGLGGPLWVDADSFALSDHVRVAPVPAPGGEAQLLAAIEELRRRRLDPVRPLWELWFLPGLTDGRVGLFVRLHHVVADGIAAMTSLGTLLDAAPDVPASQAQPWTPAPCPTGRHLLADHARRDAAEVGRALSALRRPAFTLGHARATWPAVREALAGEPGPHTSLDRVLGPGRHLALIRSRLDAVKAVAHAYGATVNDVLLAAVASGLRGLLCSRGEPGDGLALPVHVPISLRPDRSRQGAGNLISQMIVHLPVGLPDPEGSLRQIASETTMRKAMPRLPLGSMVRGKLAAGVMLKLIARQRVNLTTADLAGPPSPLYLAGARVLEVFPLLNLIGNVTLGVAALSYAGQFNLLAVADAGTYPDLDVFAAGAREALATLTAASGPAAMRSQA